MLTDANIQFELNLRKTLREYYKRLEAFTDGPTYHNFITLTFDRGQLNWRVGVGKTYESQQTAKGEVLETLIAEVIRHASELENNKVALLLPPET